MSIPATTEAATQRACLQWLSLKGYLHWRANAAAVPLPDGKGFRRFSGLRGVADVLAVLPPDGRLLACEIKGPRGKLRPEQAVFLDAVRAAGGLSMVVRSLSELIAALAAEGYA